MAVAAAAMLAVMGAAAMQGQATASVPGDWNKAFQSRNAGYFTSIAAISTTDAWAIGQVFSGGRVSYTPYIRRFDGGSWRAVTIPGAKFAADWVAASSATNVWVFGHSPSAAYSSVVYRYDGASWHRIPVPALAAFQHPVVLSPSSAWVYGYIGGAAGNVFHWNGSRWQASTLSLDPEGLSASSGSNVWVSGYIPHSKTRQVAAYKWTGSRWQYVSMSHPVTLLGAGVTASSASDVWIGWNVSGTVSRVMHWDGHQWHVITPPLGSGANTSDVVPDGRGGDWFGADVHWTGQVWTQVGLSPEGASGGIGSPVRVPGTSTFWLPGDVTDVGSSMSHPVIYRCYLS
jgi:hypothetical protein